MSERAFHDVFEEKFSELVKSAKRNKGIVSCRQLIWEHNILRDEPKDVCRDKKRL